MGRGGRGRGRGRGGRGGKRENNNKGDGTDAGGSNVWKHEPWMPLVPHNDLFEAYYKGQNLIPEAEWDAFYKALQTPLPTTFRVTATGYFADVLKERIKEAGYHNPDSFEIDGELVEPPRQIPWYPNGLAWHTSIPRKVLKRNPDLENFHKFLISQGDQGNITRQEAVSMLPPLFLDVQPHHTVLDICAAPGSKTTQIIEALHAQKNVNTNNASDKNNNFNTLPTGLVIANDVEKERCYMLVHHTKRLASPAIVVTNNPAQQYPRLPIRLDRILADVPCTGDGTLRKNVDLWRRWNPSMGPGLHALQVRIAYRAAQMLAIGGRMVYSTCSLNPAEDEAVVMELIRQTGGVMELVDVSTLLPGLKYSPGVTTWKMMDKDNKWHESYSDVPEQHRNKLRASLFPPTEEEAKKANLHYTLRILPHQQNTGGFYIAVLVKKDKLPVPTRPHPASVQDSDDVIPPTTNDQTTTTTTTTAAQTTTPGQTTTSDQTTNVVDEDALLPEDVKEEGEGEKEEKEREERGERPNKRVRKERTWIEEPFLPLSPEMRETMGKLQDYYGLANFPVDQIFTRSTKNHKLYYVTESISSLIKQIQEGPKNGLTIVNSGVKLFNRHESSELGFRVCQDSIQWVLPLITKRKVTVTHEDLVKILKFGTLYPNNFSKSAEEELNKLSQGCVVFVVDANSNDPSSGMGFVGWFSKRTIQLLIKKKELASLKNLFCPKEEKVDPATNDQTTTSTTTTTSSEAAATSSNDQSTSAAEVAPMDTTPTA